MGRIDEAMSRANLDAGRGTGAEAPAPAPSPWLIDQRESGEVPEREGAAAIDPAAGVSVARAMLAEDGRPARWGGFELDALERLVASKAAGPLLVEQFRGLAAALLRAQTEHHLKSVIVTSASPGDGKSHVSVNLALTLADSYRRRVLLVDADLRRPTLHQLFRVSNAKGLSDALTGSADGRAAVVQVSDVLTLLPSGRLEANPLSGLSSDRMKRLVADAGSRFDWVILDSPPVGVLADAHLVAETVDAALLVVRAGVTHYEDLEVAADKLGHEKILGIVLNAIDPAEIRGKRYYTYYSGSERGRS
jgi:capsular exopolysaccharide synthesis family protein